jgi:hypothetical protein
LEAAFNQLFFEGTGDIDIRYQDGGKSSRMHLQVKDHEVTLSEFKAVIAHFRKLDADLPAVYSCFKLICPSLAAKLRPIETGLARFRNASSFYDDVPGALAPTKDELSDRIRKVGLGADIEFITERVFLELGHGDLHHDERAIDMFVGRLLKHPEYADKIRLMVQPAFAELVRAIEGRRGAVLQRTDVEQILRAAVAKVAQDEKNITIWVHNWTREMFDVPADYTLDWSAQFDRSSRSVPLPEVWNTRLLTELKALKDKIAAERTERLIRFRGKCTLSTGIALGATFPAVGGWSFEIPQPPAKDAWRSDAIATNPYDFQVELTDGGGTGADLVLGLNIRGNGREDVLKYIASTGSPPKLFAFMAPNSPGSVSIGGSEDARAFAEGVRQRLGEIAKTHAIRRTRLFFYGPFALAVFLGQHLTSIGEIQLFEYQDPGYVPSFTLRT